MSWKGTRDIECLNENDEGIGISGNKVVKNDDRRRDHRGDSGRQYTELIFTYSTIEFRKYLISIIKRGRVIQDSMSSKGGNYSTRITIALSLSPMIQKLEHSF